MRLHRGVFQEPANQELNYATDTARSEPNTHNAINEIVCPQSLQEFLVPLRNTLPGYRERSFGMIRSRSKWKHGKEQLHRRGFCRTLASSDFGSESPVTWTKCPLCLPGIWYSVAEHWNNQTLF